MGVRKGSCMGDNFQMNFRSIKHGTGPKWWKLNFAGIRGPFGAPSHQPTSKYTTDKTCHFVGPFYLSDLRCTSVILGCQKSRFDKVARGKFQDRQLADRCKPVAKSPLWP